MGVNTSLPRMYVAIIGVACLVVGGLGGFFIRGLDYFSAEKAATQVAGQEKAPPPGFKRLPVRQFGNWNLVCVTDDVSGKRCDLLLRVADKKTKKLLLSMVLAKGPKKDTVFVVVTPPNVMLPAGLRVAPEGKPEMKLNFASCKPGSCEAVAQFDQAFEGAISSASQVKVAYLTGAGREVGYNIPVTGFNEGYGAWQDELKAAQP